MRPTPIYYYSSSSGLVRTFAVRLGRPAFNLADREHRTAIVTQPWVLLTPSYKSGNAHNDTIPEAVKRFLRAQENRRLGQSQLWALLPKGSTRDSRIVEQADSV